MVICIFSLILEPKCVTVLFPVVKFGSTVSLGLWYFV